MAALISATLAVLLFLGTFVMGIITVLNEDYIQLPFILTVPTVFFLCVSLTLYKWFTNKTRLLSFALIALSALAITGLLARCVSD